MDILKVHRRRGGLYIVEKELGTLSCDFPVHHYHGAAIVVETIAVTALLVRNIGICFLTASKVSQA